MTAIHPEPTFSAEASRARSRHVEWPRCDALRACAAATAALQYLLAAQGPNSVGLGPGVRAGYAFMGFLLAGFLLRGRSGGGEGDLASKAESWGRTISQVLPVSSMILVIAGVLIVPRLLPLESIPAPDLAELPALIVGLLHHAFADFQGSTFDGRSLIAWPIVVALAPRRLLGPAFVGVLASGLTLQFSGLISAEVRPSSILVGPSPLDFLSLGALAAAIMRPDGGRLGRWAMLMGLVLAGAALGSRTQAGPADWGTVALLSAPPGFGAINFILQIMATTLVASLAWRDLGGILDGLAPAHRA